VHAPLESVVAPLVPERKFVIPGRDSVFPAPQSLLRALLP
jgi:hypothetical protein